MRRPQRLFSALLALCLAVGLAVPAQAAGAANENVRTLMLTSAEQASGAWSHSAKLDGETVPEYDYAWHCDPSEAHSGVKNAPAEYYTGTEPGNDAVYIAHDIFYYPELPVSGFKKVSYDGDQEWAYYYTDGENDGYIFATLPVQGSSVPTQMMHTPEEAYQNAVLHITQAGTYILEGEWHGQIWIDLGSGADADPSAKVTLILNGVDVTCTVAPALVFYRVYECDQAWLAYDNGEVSSFTPSKTVDTSAAGAVAVIADGTENNFNGTNVYRMLKTTYKSGQEGKAVPVQKKQRKTDGAFYSYMSMNIEGGPAGTGVLNVTSGFEGVDSEQHLTFNGGHVNIFSQDDGINVNEDGVSVVTFNGGEVHILAGLGSEGDGVDSNGFLVINGGTVISIANPSSDSGLDSDCGSYVNGGTVVALGSTMDWAEADDSNDSGQVTMNLQFSGAQSSDEAIIITDTTGKVVFAYDPDKDEVAAGRTRSYRGAVISSPALQVGQTYYVYVGGDVTGTETAGIYDVSTVTAFTSDAKQQCWTGTWENNGRPGMGGDGQPGDMTPPDGFGGGQPGGGMTPPDGFDGQTPPDGFGGGQRPDTGGFDGQMPDSFDPAQMGQRPGGGMRQSPDGGQMGDWHGTGTASVEFYMEDKVNNFSGVTDADGSGAAQPATPSIGSGGIDPDESGTAREHAVTVTVGGVSKTFKMYALGNMETNYIKLRDLADALDGTTAQFTVQWDGSISLKTGVPYADEDRNGTENNAPYSGDQPYRRNTASISINGVSVQLTAFTLNNGGSTYFKLRDLGQALGFNVGWSSGRGIFVEPDKPYSYDD